MGGRVMKIHTGDTFKYFGRNYVADEVVTDSGGHIEVSGHEAAPVTGYTGACFYHELGSSETKILGEIKEIKLEPRFINFDWGYSKPNYKYRIKKIQINPKKNATTVIFESGHVEVVKKNDLDPEADLYSVVAYAVAKYVYGSNSAFKRQIRDCIFESLEVK
jgi:hypothetical protein